MKKGQISIDLTLTIIVAVLIIMAFSGVTTQIRDNQKEINLKNQLENESIEIANLINKTQIFNNANFRIEKEIKWLNFGEKKGPATITIDENKITISETISGKNLSAENYFYKRDSILIEIEKDKLVIKSE